MSLMPGARLGPYEIVAPLGAGGMGEVYRARDARLGREVAIKVLSDRLAGDADSLARFEREARAAAALSHPSICTIHDVGHEGEVAYIAMELVEGETLAERLRKGALPLEHAVRIGVEICSALAAAHDRGIVHRDLKPANVMLTGAGVKLLDFGLAKVFREPASGEQDGVLPTMGLTQEGLVLGTPAYMAPEQIEGRAADARTDIFALGAVLYEMATARRAFEGTSQASLVAAILRAPAPSITALRPSFPSALDDVVQTCLAKDPGDRWQSARDIALLLRGVGTQSGVVPTHAARPRRLLLVAAAASLAAILATLAVVRARTPPAPVQRAIRFTVPPPAGGAFNTGYEQPAIAVSPDGSALAYSAFDAGGLRLWLRPLASTEARALPGSDGAFGPFWSPDGRSLGFFAGDKLKRLDLAGGPPLTLCDVPSGVGLSGTWGDGRILFAATAVPDVIYAVPAAGGPATPLVNADVPGGDRRVGWPAFLPDGQRFLYLRRRADGTWTQMLAEPGRDPRSIANMASAAQYLGPGHLAYVREGTLLAQPFDWKAGRLFGEPAAIAESIRYFLPTGMASFAASAAGTLAFQGDLDITRLVWMDRAGHETGSIGGSERAYHRSVRFADGERRVLYDRAQMTTGAFDVWSYDVARQAESRLTSDPEVEAAPRWIPGGAIAYSANLRGGPLQLVRRDLATGRDEPLGPQGRFRMVQDVSADGRTLLYSERTERGNDNLWALSLQGPPEPRPLHPSPASDAHARFSPDGRLVAYVSDQSGASEAYVMPYPGPGESVRISTSGARAVAWSGDGREVFVLTADNRMVSVPIQTTPSFQTGTPRVLFDLGPKRAATFDVAPDGQRFIVVITEVRGNALPMTVVVDAAGAAR